MVVTRPPHTMSLQERTEKLLALVDLVTKASHTVIEEWRKESAQPSINSTQLPSWDMYNAQRTIIAACGAFSELVQDPRRRLMEVVTGYSESRAMHIALQLRFADVLARLDPSGANGVHIDALAAEVGIHPTKLCESLSTCRKS